MRLLIASDIHGDIDGARSVISAFKNENCDKLLLLGDILYFGPRNRLTEGYSPKEVVSLLNEYRDSIICVRGNCDSEVDQMVLDFPILADYSYLFVDGLSIFATHGHHFNLDAPPPLRKGEILLHGHTHVIKCEEFGNGNWYINPGSIAFPKEGNESSYMIYENRCFTVKRLTGEVIFSKQF